MHNTLNTMLGSKTLWIRERNIYYIQTDILALIQFEVVESLYRQLRAVNFIGCILRLVYWIYLCICFCRSFS